MYRIPPEPWLYFCGACTGDWARLCAPAIVRRHAKPPGHESHIEIFVAPGREASHAQVVSASLPAEDEEIAQDSRWSGGARRRVTGPVTGVARPCPGAACLGNTGAGFQRIAAASSVVGSPRLVRQQRKRAAGAGARGQCRGGSARGQAAGAGGDAARARGGGGGQRAEGGEQGVL